MKKNKSTNIVIPLKNDQVRLDSFPPVAVIIPAYQADKHILKVIAGIPTYVSTIIVVNDGSHDRTAELVLGYTDKRICLISHAKNQGVGAAVLTGYKKAVELGAKIIVKMDADGQMDPTYLIPLIAPILANRADYTKGNRFLHATKLKTMPFIRRIGNIGLTFLTKAASGYWNVFDPANGYTAISAKIIPLILNGRISRRFFFETSLLLELGLIGAVVEDVSIPALYSDEKSHLNEWKALIEFPIKLIKGLFRRIIFQYYLRDFSAFSLLFVCGIFSFLFGVFWGIDFWIRSIRTEIVSSTGTVMIAVLPIILGTQFLLQALMVDIQNIPMEPLSNTIDIKSLELYLKEK